MKKLFFLLFASVLLSSCACLLSQVPPKYLYANSNCIALIPDYRSMVTVTGGCTGFTLTQTPAPGYQLTASNQVANVTIKATGTNNKSRQITFSVTMIDTVTPRITPLPALLTYQMNEAEKMFKAGDTMTKLILDQSDVAFNNKILVRASWDSAGYRKGVTMFLDSLEFPMIRIDSAQLSRL